jgi:hypothetical protein
MVGNKRINWSLSGENALSFHYYIIYGYESVGRSKNKGAQ